MKFLEIVPQDIYIWIVTDLINLNDICYTHLGQHGRPPILEKIEANNFLHFLQKS